MGIRSTVGSTLESTIGRERTNTIRRPERKLATRWPSGWRWSRRRSRPRSHGQNRLRPSQHQLLKPSRWQPPDPFASHPEPTMSRHELLEGLHEKTRPRTYLEIGIRTGRSLTLSRTRSIAVDPLFTIDKPIHCDVQMIKATSDDFFAGDDPLAHFDGIPVDLAFIDGMHLSEFALRDFINIEPYMADTGVVVFDDVLPRNGLEAARDRKTEPWTGDVYKVVEICAGGGPIWSCCWSTPLPPAPRWSSASIKPPPSSRRRTRRKSRICCVRIRRRRRRSTWTARSPLSRTCCSSHRVWSQLASIRESRMSADLRALWGELRSLAH